MSSLGMQGLGGGLKFKPSGWEVLAPWATHARMKAEERELKRLAAVSAQEQQRINVQEQQRLDQEARQFKSVQNLQAKVVARLQQLEAEAEKATQSVIQIRELANSPVLGPSDLEGLDAALLDIEKAVITIQAGTVVDTGTFDTSELAQGYSDASSAYVAMRTVTSRATSLLKALQQGIRDRTAEQIRIKFAEAEHDEQLAVRVREQRQLEEQRRLALEDRAREDARRDRRDLMTQVLKVRRELSKEKRRLGSLRVTLANLRLAQADRAARQAAYAR